MHVAGRSPADCVAAVERGGSLPEGARPPGTGAAGYVVLGVPFATGEMLSLRRFPVTSAGVGWTSVAHRAPDGQWTVYSDVPLDRRQRHDTRLFGPAVHDTVVAPIRIDWTSATELNVAVDGGRQLSWCIGLTPTLATSALNAVLRRIPAGWRDDPRVLTLVAAGAAIAARTGRLRLTGSTPAGFQFQLAPSAFWLVEASRAAIHGRDAGRFAPSRRSPPVDGWTPRRPLFAIGSALLVPP